MAVSARTKAAAALALLVVVVLVATRPRAPAAPQFAYSAHGFRVNGGPSRPLLEPNEAEYQMSEGGQDRVLWEELFRNDSQADSGFFVEFGARGGVYDSNTYFFEKKLGWRGLLLEASPTEQKTIGADRPLSAAIDGGVCESDQKLEFAAAEKGWGGRLDSYDKSRAKRRPADARRGPSNPEQRRPGDHRARRRARAAPRAAVLVGALGSSPTARPAAESSAEHSHRESSTSCDADFQGF